MNKVLLVLCLLSVLYQSVQGQIKSIHASNVIFKFYDEVGEEYQANTIWQEESFQKDVRYNKDKLSIIVHGWRESCSTEWVTLLIKNLNEFRGGTIICMDYSYFASEENYFRLVRHFDSIAEVLQAKLKDLQAVGYDPENMYLFGFSYGGQLVVEAGKRFGPLRIKQIDTCDMAGPGFDNKPTSDHRLAAQNVQCIHTSRDKGTRYSLCNQNWKMGNCGNSQIAAGRPPYGSHGLCPYFYNSAFRHPFYAVPKPKQCRSKVAALRWPKRFRMGYLEDRKELVKGELFGLTSREYPFNVLDNTDGEVEDNESTNEVFGRRSLNSTQQLDDSYDLKYDDYLTGFTATGEEDPEDIDQ